MNENQTNTGMKCCQIIRSKQKTVDYCLKDGTINVTKRRSYESCHHKQDSDIPQRKRTVATPPGKSCRSKAQVNYGVREQHYQPHLRNSV